MSDPNKEFPRSPVTPRDPNDDLDGYDESQRAEIHEALGGGPTDGLLQTDMARDRGEDMDDLNPAELAAINVHDDTDPDVSPDDAANAL